MFAVTDYSEYLQFLNSISCRVNVENASYICSRGHIRHKRRQHLIALDFIAIDPSP